MRALCYLRIRSRSLYAPRCMRSDEQVLSSKKLWRSMQFESYIVEQSIVRRLIKAIAHYLLLLGAVGPMSGCGFFDSGTSWQSGQFLVRWIDTHSNSNLSYRFDSFSSIGIVDACVFAVGANGQYLVVKQRPLSRPGTVNYYVLSKARYDPHKDPRQALTGPLTEMDYRALSGRLLLPAMESVIPEAACGRSAG
jgi:hypothetical protein